MKKFLRVAKLAVAGALLAVLSACGGGGYGGSTPPAALNITTTTTPDGVVGTAYNLTVAATGGNGAQTFSISAGSLPAGLALNVSTGAITGTPAGPAGTASFSVQVVDSGGGGAYGGTPQQSDTQALTIDIVNPLLITSGALPGTAIGAAYSQTIAASGGTTPYTFSVSTGALPAGVTLNAATGAITGPATAAATSQNLTVRVADSSSPQLSVTQAQSISVVLEIATTSLPDATAGAAYSQTLQARGGTPPYVNWTRIAGSIPAGIADPVATTGVINGTPSLVCTAATATFTAQVSDSAVPPASDSQAGIGITVNPGPALNITTTTMPNGVVATPYNVIVQATGGVPPYAFSTTGALPSKLGPINGLTGQIAGTPDTIETRNFSVNVSDSCGTIDTQALSITINAVSPGRNDSIATATTLGNGVFFASISPSGNPNTIVNPDEDYYRVTTTTASTVTVDINARSINSPLDSVIEIVNAAGTRLTTCDLPPFASTFASICVDDDEDTANGLLDSLLRVQVSSATTFYVHVVDFRGDARPDLKYTISISGVN